MGHAGGSGCLAHRLDDLFGKWNVLRLTIVLVNSLASHMIYAGKIQVFIHAVLGTFYLLRHFKFDILSIVTLAATADALISQTIILGRCYVVPQNLRGIQIGMKVLLGVFMEHHSCFLNAKQAKVMRARVRAMRAIAVQEGHFRGVYSNSSPEFFGFYLNQVIALLML